MKFFNSRFAKLGIALALVAGVTSTKAGNPGDGISGVYNTYVVEGSYYDTGSAAVQNSTLVTERRTTTVASEAQANMVLSQIADRFDGFTSGGGNSVSLLPQAGGNAGAAMNRSSVWARVGYDRMQEDNVTSLGGWNANLWSLAVGYDYKINDKTIAGLALTYSNLNGSTKFNNGNMRDNAYGVVPYIALRAAPCFDVDLMIGYSRVNKTRSRGTQNAANANAVDLSGTKATSSPRSDRYFVAVHGTYKTLVNRWTLLSRLGFLLASDNQKSFTEKNGSVIGGLSDLRYGKLNTRVNRLSLRLQAGYKVSNMVEPYAFLMYARDFGASKITGVSDTAQSNPGGIIYVNPNRRRSNDTYGGGLGLNANMNNGWNTALEGTYAQSKKFKTYGGMVRVRKVF